MIDFTAFSHGQVISKQWLCEIAEPIIREKYSKPVKIAILGGWYGVLGFMLFTRNNIQIDSISSYDIDDKACTIADKVNNAWLFEKWRFKSVVSDVNDIDLSKYDVVINSSSEHIIDRQWFERITTQLLIIQGTDQIHDDNDPHEYVFSTDQLLKHYPIRSLFTGTKNFVYPDKEFNRYMIVGFKQPCQP